LFIFDLNKTFFLIEMHIFMGKSEKFWNSWKFWPGFFEVFEVFRVVQHKNMTLPFYNYICALLSRKTFYFYMTLKIL
jgi:hypothetical protein